MKELGELGDAAKKAFTIRNIVMVGLGAFAVLVVLDLLGVTPWLLAPVTTAKAKWAARKTTAG